MQVTSYNDDKVGPSFFVLAKWPSPTAMFMKGADLGSQALGENPKAESLAKTLLDGFGLKVRIEGKISGLFGVETGVLIDISQNTARFEATWLLFGLLQAELKVEIGLQNTPSFRAEGTLTLDAHQDFIAKVCRANAVLYRLPAPHRPAPPCGPALQLCAAASSEGKSQCGTQQ